LIAGKVKLTGVEDELVLWFDLEIDEGDISEWECLDGGPDFGVKAIADPLRALGTERPWAFNTGEC
jgi:hypothetical protein